MLALTIGCASPPEPPPPPEPLTVEVARCAEVRRGPACVLSPERALHLWLAPPSTAPAVIRAGGRRLDAAPTPVQGGRLFRLVVPEGADAVEVTAGRGRWRLPLSPAAPSPALDAALQLKRDGDLAGAAEKARAAVDAASGAERSAAIAALGRIERQQGRIDDAVVHLREAMRGFREAGHVSGEAQAAGVLAYALSNDTRRLTEARAALEGQPSDPAAYPEGAAFVPYYQALVAVEAGDLRTAMARFDLADERCARLGLDALRGTVRLGRARALLELGRAAEAAAALSRIRAELPPDADACTKMWLLTSLGWAQLFAAPDRPEAAAAARATWTEALAAERAGCPSPVEAASIHVNLALAAVRTGQLDEARAALEAAHRERPEGDARTAVWRLDLEGRIALGESKPAAALETFERLARLAEAGELPEAKWRAAVGRGEALDALGRADEAEATWRAAERLLTDRALLIPLGEGRDTFLGDHARGTALLVDLLERRGRPADALATARQARGRILAALRRAERIAGLPEARRAAWEARISGYRAARAALDADAAGDWRLQPDQLAQAHARREAERGRLRAELDAAFALLAEGEPGAEPPRPPAEGELLLLYHPGRAGWIGFAQDAAGVVARRLPSPEPAALLAPFADRLDAARSVRVLPYGALRAVDFHALPHRGDALVARLPVSYGLDLEGPGVSGPPDRRALVVADPRGDLRGARGEAGAVTAALAPAWRTEVLAGEAATRGAVVGGLGAARLLHYAGHGVYAGRGGWSSALPLTGTATLAVGDILALPAVPPYVVLSGCETGRTSAEGPAEGMGLAHAFLAAGSRAVVAAVRPVEDALAAAMSRHLYAALGAGDQPDLPTALRAAQIALRREMPGADWSGFRVMTR